MRAKLFGQSHTVDWPILPPLGLKEELRGMLRTNAWSESSQEEKVYRDNTLVVFSQFELDRALICFDRAGSIPFHLFKEQRTLTYIEFALLLRIYNTDFTGILQYEQLLIDFPPGVTPRVSRSI